VWLLTLAGGGCGGQPEQKGPSYAEALTIYNQEVEALNRLREQRDKLKAALEKPAASNLDIAQALLGNTADLKKELSGALKDLDIPTGTTQTDAAVKKQQDLLGTVNQQLEQAKQQQEQKRHKWEESKKDIEAKLAELDKQIADQEQRVTRAKADRDAAEAARRVAETEKRRAETQRRLAVEAKQAETYEAYVARIGLAKAKIDANSFDRALELLDQCPPALRQWEWGRLAHLCRLSQRDWPLAGPVEAVAFSPDGRHFACGDWDGKARVGEIDREDWLQTFSHGQYVHAVAFDPQGERLATGSSDHICVDLDGRMAKIPAYVMARLRTGMTVAQEEDDP
jgi:hypothetical protein